MKPPSTDCSLHPSILFLLLTLMATSAATAMLCVAMITQHWEYVSWDKEKLGSIEKNITSGSSDGNTYRLEWLLDGQVARIVLGREGSEAEMDADPAEEAKKNNDLPALFLVPIRGGIWTYCINLSAGQHQLLRNVGFPNALCTDFLKLRTLMEGNKRMDRQHRMRNLSISCALVCLVILSASALTGAFGVTKRQISAILVTGVMYLLAGTFATFSLTIINFKRTRNVPDCLITDTSFGYAGEGVIASTTALEKVYSLNKVNKYFAARIFSTGYSLRLGWGGIAACTLVSILWISLSKMTRCNPVNALVMVP